jgi:hypothetical protein
MRPTLGRTDDGREGAVSASVWRLVAAASLVAVAVATVGTLDGCVTNKTPELIVSTALAASHAQSGSIQGYVIAVLGRPSGTSGAISRQLRTFVVTKGGQLWDTYSNNETETTDLRPASPSEVVALDRAVALAKKAAPFPAADAEVKSYVVRVFRSDGTVADLLVQARSGRVSPLVGLRPVGATTVAPVPATTSTTGPGVSVGFGLEPRVAKLPGLFTWTITYRNTSGTPLSIDPTDYPSWGVHVVSMPGSQTVSDTVTDFKEFTRRYGGTAPTKEKVTILPGQSFTQSGPLTISQTGTFAVTPIEAVHPRLQVPPVKVEVGR